MLQQKIRRGLGNNDEKGFHLQRNRGTCLTVCGEGYIINAEKVLGRYFMENNNLQLTQADRLILESYKVLCEGLALYLGEGYELVLHSLENYDRSVIKIINGYYTGRSEGAPITDLALQMLEKIGDRQSTDYISYNSRNKRGEPMHSTTIAIRGENARIIGLLCINFYLNTPYASIIRNLTSSRENTFVKGETYAEEPSQLVSETVSEVQRVVMADSEIAASDKNKEIVARLYSKGIFNFKDSVANCAAALGISRNTVYMHIRGCKGTAE